MSEDSGAGEARASYPDLAGRTAIVSGTSRGIGCGIAEVLGGQGMRLTLTARTAEAGAAFAAGLEAAGVECQFIAADVATPEGAQAVFDAAIGRFGRVDLLVNNAAQTRSRPMLELDEQWYRDSFERNVRLVYGPSLVASRHMAEAGGGNIIHISSVGGLRAHRGTAGYDASKGAIDALTRAMAIELAEHGIRVNGVAPGATQRGAPSPKYEQFRKERIGRIPLGRMATPREIGWAVAFLASDVAAYITGQVLYVDGGLTAQLTPPGIYV